MLGDPTVIAVKDYFPSSQRAPRHPAEAPVRSPAPDTGAPRVTVVIPTYDRPEELSRAIRTVQGQTLTDWQLVIVDDGSPRPVVLPADAAADKRVTLMRHDVGRGVSHARNAGIERARAPWIAFLDDDDLWWPGKLDAQLAAAEEHGSTFLFTARVTIDAAGHVISKRRPPPTADLTRTLLAWNLVGEPSSVMVHRDALAAAGGFEPNLSVIADWDMWLRLSRVAVAHGLPLETTAILAHPGSMQLAQAMRIPQEVDAMRSQHADLLEPAVAAHRTDLAEMEMWMVNKQWRARRSVSNLLAYVRVAHRHRQVSAVAGRLVARKLALASARPGPLADDWVLRQLGTADAA